MKDEFGVKMMINLNDEYAHIYVSSAEQEVVVLHQTNDLRRRSDSDWYQLEIESSKHNNPSNTWEYSYGDASLAFASIWIEILIEERQVFEDVNMFHSSIFKFLLAHRFSYKFSHNKPNYVKVHCVVEGFPWKVSARSDGDSSTMSIKTFVKVHSYSAGDLFCFKPKFNAKLMGSIFMDKIVKNYSYLPREICKDAQNELKIEMTYHQAWTTKERSKHMLDGKPDDSYKLIPWNCARLKHVMPETIATWECYKGGTFKQLFVAYESSIFGFHAGCRPLIFVDACHLSGPYKGTLLTACALDANNEMYPLAYGVVTSENDEDWFWFLKHLKYVVQDREVVVIFDRNPSILRGVDLLFGARNHAHCFRHLQENFSSFINKNVDVKLQSASKKRAMQYLNEVAYARTQRSYDNTQQ